jgi:hypothetical protein
LRCFVGGEAAGNFQRFIDGYSARSGFVKKLVYGKSQDITIDHRHACDTPMFRSRTYALIQSFQMRKGTGR